MLTDLQVQRSSFSNGLRLITVAMPHMHTVTVAAFVKVGSRFESPADNGLSHFVEHMLFRGTERYQSSYELNLAFESLGSSLHAETGRDYSLYQTSVEFAQLNESLELFSELLQRPLFTDIELERRLILEEVTEDYDESDNEINGADIARGLLLPGALGQRIIGPKENVHRFSEGDVRRHFEKFYCGSSIVLAVAGPITHDAVQVMVQKQLASLSPGKKQGSPETATNQAGPHFRHVHETGAQCQIDVVWRGLPERDPLYMAQGALLQVVDDGMASRLHYRLCDQKGLAYNLGASIEPLHDTSLIEVCGSTANHKTPELLREIIKLMEELRDHEISNEELARIKRRYRYEMASLQDDAASMVAWFGGTSLYYLPPSLSARAEQFESVTASDIREAARRIICPERLAVVIVGTLDSAQVESVRSACLTGAATEST